MEADLRNILASAQSEILTAADESALEELRLKYLGKKSALSAVSGQMRTLSPEQKASVGALLNEARSGISSALDSRKAILIEAREAAEAAAVDVSLPGRRLPPGALHPMTQVLDRAIQILRRMGFALATGPEVETEWHCFDALNTPADHPARNETDTFYFDSGLLLRTHTSTVQIRTMESQSPPVRIIAPGSAFRRDEIDATHLSAFTQIEGLYVTEKVSLGDLKGTLEQFLHSLLGRETQIRFRPHFFPFTEPSYEVDVLLRATGQAPRWVEILGCGMVDPAVFSAICTSRGDSVYDPDKVTGFAFGMGLERLAMTQWGISDIRHLIENDLRFLRQFA